MIDCLKPELALAPSQIPLSIKLVNLSFSAFALSVDGRRALFLSPLSLFVVPSSPKTSRDERTNRRQRER